MSVKLSETQVQSILSLGRDYYIADHMPEPEIKAIASIVECSKSSVRKYLRIGAYQDVDYSTKYSRRKAEEKVTKQQQEEEIKVKASIEETHKISRVAKLLIGSLELLDVPIKSLKDYNDRELLDELISRRS